MKRRVVCEFTEIALDTGLKWSYHNWFRCDSHEHNTAAIPCHLFNMHIYILKTKLNTKRFPYIAFKNVKFCWWFSCCCALLLFICSVFGCLEHCTAFECQVLASDRTSATQHEWVLHAIFVYSANVYHTLTYSMTINYLCVFWACVCDVCACRIFFAMIWYIFVPKRVNSIQP